jgi:predicted TIM-barrel fold metal-dependent hydrolase
VEERGGVLEWVCDGVSFGRVSSGATILPDLTKSRGFDFYTLKRDEVHASAWDPMERVKVLDMMGIYAQIEYPDVAGLGGENFMAVKDREVRRLCCSVFNDAAAEIQEQTSGRVLPMALVPWWEVEGSVAEVKRASELGLKGIVMCSDPQNRGAPDLGEPAWDPFWRACIEYDMPVNFHIGASNDVINGWYGKTPWPSMTDDEKVAIGSTMLVMSNMQVIANMIMAGTFERFPELKMVSVESGIGWIPPFLEALDYQFHEFSFDRGAKMRITKDPSQYFHDHIHACFWFEKAALGRLEDFNADHIMFETDYPHPTCLFLDTPDLIIQHFQNVDPVIRRKALQDNAAKLYKIDLPKN